MIRNRGWLRGLAFLTAVGVFSAACAKVPVTGRKQLNLIPDSIMMGLGRSQWAETIHASRVTRKGEDADTLRTVGDRISKVANRPDYAWRYALIDEPEVNAWCLPGGYIGIYTGVLPVLKNEAGMAFVMGHEVGHAVAHHGGERLSQQLAILGGLAGVGLYLEGKEKMNDTQRGIILGALGAGAEVGIALPFSRKHESEADAIGLMFMAGAGYPPEESIKVWDRMTEIAGPQKIPAFLSTHPSNEKRQKNLREWMPKAKKRFQRNRLDRDTLRTLWKP